MLIPIKFVLVGNQIAFCTGITPFWVDCVSIYAKLLTFFEIFTHRIVSCFIFFVFFLLFWNEINRMHKQKRSISSPSMTPSIHGDDGGNEDDTAECFTFFFFFGSAQNSHYTCKCSNKIQRFWFRMCERVFILCQFSLDNNTCEYPIWNIHSIVICWFLPNSSEQWKTATQKNHTKIQFILSLKKV